MIVRAVDANNDWQFGKGRNDYKKDALAVNQNVQTRLQEFLGDCFFNIGAGIDWFNLLGGKDLTALNLAISSVILNTQEVTGLLQLSTKLDQSRRLTIQYRVQTSYGTQAQAFTLDPVTV